MLYTPETRKRYAELFKAAAEKLASSLGVKPEEAADNQTQADSNAQTSPKRK
jgi:hypothetical protein